MNVRTALLIAALVSGAFPARAEEPLPPDALRALVEDMARASDFAQWWREHESALTIENAVAARELGTAAVESSQLGMARAFFTFAAFTHLHLGDRVAALDAMFNDQQLQYVLAATPEEYGEVRKSALSFLAKARQANASNLAVRFATLAANCSFFAHEGEGDDIEGESVAIILRDVNLALHEAERRTAELNLEDLASLTAATVQIAMREFYRNAEEIFELLHETARASESVVASNFSFANQEEKTIDTAEVLARLSLYHGSPVVAAARLEHAQARAWAIGDDGEYFEALVQQYDTIKNSTNDRTRLAELRGCARAVAADRRSSRRSRAGRIWTAYEFDRACGEMLRDELLDEKAEPALLFAPIEAAKARTLLDHLDAPPRPLPAALSAREGELEHAVLGFGPDGGRDGENLVISELRLISQLSSFSEFGSDPASRGRALAALEELYATNRGGFTKAIPPSSLEEIQAALAPDEAIVEYVIPFHPLHPASALAILVVTKDRVMGVHMDLTKLLPQGDVFRMSRDGEAPVDASVIGDQVVELRVAIRRSDELRAQRILRGLHELLIAPLLANGFDPSRYARLVIVPHGMLHYVPFAALLDEKHVPLIRSTAVVLAPSASAWLRLQRRNAAVRRWVGYAPTTDAADLPSLEASETEVAQIAEMLRPLASRIVSGADATRERFADDTDAGILHIATHGEFPDDNAIDQHGLLLSGDDATLRARDVRNLNLGAARLVVLSVCNGGLYRIGPTDEPYGLIPAFLLAGAQNVLATLWPLDDQFGRRFTVEFYRQLMTKGPAEAHRAAVLHFLDEDELIRNWAAFVLVGPGRPF